MPGCGTSRPLLLMMDFVLQLRADGGLNHSPDHPNSGSCPLEMHVEAWEERGQGALVHWWRMDLLGAQCWSCPPLSINAPLACGSGVASNSLIYATTVSLTN